MVRIASNCSRSDSTLCVRNGNPGGQRKNYIWSTSWVESPKEIKSALLSSLVLYTEMAECLNYCSLPGPCK